MKSVDRPTLIISLIFGLKRHPYSQVMWGVMSGGLVTTLALPGMALPQAPSVQSGRVQIQQRQGRLNVVQKTPKASINWNRFSIGAKEGVYFRQPSSRSVILNRVTGDVRSEIAGALKANGTVLLINPNGILFSPTAKVDVGGILATTLDIQDRDFLSGNYVFRQSKGAPFATVENFGSISVKDGGFAALVAPGVANYGVIQAKFGQVALGAGTAFTLDFYRDGLLAFEVDSEYQGLILGSDGKPIQSLLDQSGQIQADGGSVFLTVQSGADILGNLINLDGVTQAQTVAKRKGKIVLSGRSSQPTLVSGLLDVSGNDIQEQAGTIEIKGTTLALNDATLNADGATGGGQIFVSADETVAVNAGSTVSADSTLSGDAGAIALLSEGTTVVNGSLSAVAQGTGNGGTVETSGKTLAIGSTTSVKVGASQGQSGLWTIDPDRLFVDDMGESLPAPDAGDFTVAADVIETALADGNVSLQATELIEINAPIDTSDSGIVIMPGDDVGNLSLLDQDADGDLTVNLNAPITLALGKNLMGNASEVNVGIAANGIAQNAVDVAASDAVVTLGAGTFNRGVGVGFPGVIDIDKNLTIQGQGPDQTIIDGDLGDGVFDRGVRVASGVTAKLQDLAIVNGNAANNGNDADNDGGGILVETNADLTIDNVKLENNSAELGGGIFSLGNLTILDSVITGNNAIGDPDVPEVNNDGASYTYTFSLKGTGAGIFSGLNSELNVVQSQITENNAESAGGGVVSVGTTVLDQTTIADNTSTQGAGILNLGSMTLSNSTVSGNIASGSAGGISNGPEYIRDYYFSSFGATDVENFGQLNVTNTTISGNESGNLGGGLVNYAGDVQITNSTITGNQAAELFGGIGNGFSETNNGGRSIAIANSIVSGNEAASSPEAFTVDGTSTFESQGFNLVGQNGDAGGFPTQANDIVLTGTVDSVLAPLADNGGATQTHALIADSPAIDAGSNDLAVDGDGNPLTTDQRGGERSPSGLNAGDAVDIGAFEATSSAVVTTTADDNTLGTLRAAVDFVNGSQNNNPANIADPAPNTIRFAPSLFDVEALDDPTETPTPVTLELQKGELTLSNSETPILVDGPNVSPPILGTPGTSLLTISGADQSGIFNLDFGTSATLQGVTLSNGQAELGGAINIQPSADLTVTQSQIRNNFAENGGAIYNQGTVTVTRSFIEENGATNDGGGLANVGGTVLIDETFIRNNNAGGEGGGLSNAALTQEGVIQGNLTLDNSFISDNTSDDGGGGIANRNSRAAIQNSEISGNEANEDGGGILNDEDGSVTVANSRVIGNQSSVDGGGVNNRLGTVEVLSSELSDNIAAERGGGLQSEGLTTLTNTTISGNDAGVRGGGLAVDGGTTTATHVTIALNQVNEPGGEGLGGGVAVNNSTLNLDNSLVSGNVADLNPEYSEDSDTIFNSNGNNFVGQNGDRGGFPTSENVFETPFEANLSPLEGHGSITQTHALLPGSTAIDPGGPELVEVDQRGISRPRGNSSDAGAFESQGFSILFQGGEGQSTVVNTDFPNTLSFQVSANDSLEPVEGGRIPINAPSEGPSLATPTLSLEIESEGVAETPIKANTVAGTYEAIAGFGDELISINLENLPDLPALITAFSGTPQDTEIETSFGPLEARVTDQFGNVLSNVPVSFEAPISGPSVIFTSPVMTSTNEFGIASVELRANAEGSPIVSGTDGSSDIFQRYFVLARSGELTPAEFSLANIDDSEPPVTPPVIPPVTPPITPPGTPPTPTESEEPTSGGPVEKVDQALKQTLNPADPPESPTTPPLRPTPAVALTPRLEEQVANLETVFTSQHQQFLGIDAVEILQPQDVSEQLNQAQSGSDFNPAVIYAFFTPKGASSAQAERSTNAYGLQAAAEQGIFLAQTGTVEDCLSNRQVRADDPLWQFDTCGWNNFAPATRPAQASDQLVLLLVTPKGRAIRQVVPDAVRSQVLSKVKEFQRTVTDLSLPASESQLLGQQMYDWIVRPLAEELEAEEINNLVFILDEGLRSMPLAAMHDGTSYLIENYSVGLMPSMSLADTSFVSVKDMQVLAMGAEEFQGQSPLPSVPVEISTIAQDIWQGEAFLNESFTPQALKTARTNNGFGIVHLATHGEFRPGDRDRSYIQFWDSKVRIDQLTDLGLTNDPAVSLLVLSACRTALGDPNAELGFTGFAVASGVQTAMGGLWYVSDLGTLGLMTSFYQNLQTAPIKAEALRQAQLSLLTGETRIEDTQVITPNLSIPLPEDLQQITSLDLSHPYYWSGITMIGTPW